MPTPSLLIVPARFKTGRLYSQIPTSGAGDFTITRNTTATRFTSAGLIESVASGIPRLDYYTSGGTAGCPALLVEPAGTNLVQRSEEFSNAYWSKGSGANVVADDAVAPDGTTTADRINLVSGSTISRVERTAGLAYTASTDYTLSFFLKNIALTSGQTFAIRLEGTGGFDLVGTVTLFSNTISVALTGTAGTGFVSGSQKSTVENYGNGWYRYSISLRTGTTAGNAAVYLITNVDANRSFYAWGAQLETGSVATSYIPTTAGTGSRSADVVSVSGAVSGSIGQTEGVLYIECESNDGLDDVIFVNRSVSNGIALYKNASNAYIGRIFHSSASILFTSANNITGMVKIAIAYKSGDSTMYLNGSRVGTLNTGAITFNAALNSLVIEKSAGFISGIKSNRIRAVALYNTRLTNAELATLTTL